MTDEELIDYTDPDIIARQNIAPNAGCNIDGKFYDVRNLVHLASSQADRIEELLAERKKDHANINLKADFIDKTINQLAEADAKLAQAVEALGLIVVDNTWGLEHETYMKCRTTLAEIKGESHD